MKFTKIQGAGNDFIIINNFELKIPVEKLSSLAIKVCERRVSLGADALMVVDKPTHNGDFKMRFYNADGTVGEMCGNGARCIARYAFENKVAKEFMTIETVAGNVYATKIDNRKYKVKLNNPQNINLDVNINFNEKIYECSYLELGNPGLPHAVIKVDKLDKIELLELAKKVRYYEGFPKGANVNFYTVTGDNELDILTYERGVEGFTLACGTGSGSTALVSILKGLCVKNKPVSLNTMGGILSIDIEFKNEEVENLYLIGDTNIIAIGEIMDEDLI